MPPAENPGQGFICSFTEITDAETFRIINNVNQMMRNTGKKIGSGFGCPDVQVPVHLKGIGTHHLGSVRRYRKYSAEHFGFTDPGRSEEKDNLRFVSSV
jgi:hypothetical protein